MIAAPRFWWRRRPNGWALLLGLPALAWGAVSGRRMRRAADVRADVPVICVGNYVVGGAGKTPTALALARILQGLGHHPGFLTRGYGGSLKGPVLVDRDRHGAADVGDEALLLAELGPVVVSADRPKALRHLAEAGVDVIIMDDGFQNPALAKDLRLVVIDGAAGIGNGMVLPAGPLRAPLRTQIARTDAAIIVGAGSGGDAMLRRTARAGRPSFRARLATRAHQEFGSEPYLAYAGIGRPEKFFNTLDHAGANLKSVRPFPDHHVYTEDDARKLIAEADQAGMRLITTSKDHARLSSAQGAAAELRARSEVLAVRMVFADEPRLVAFIEEMLREFASR